jgi:hypothetical protein
MRSSPIVRKTPSTNHQNHQPRGEKMMSAMSVPLGFLLPTAPNTTTHVVRTDAVMPRFVRSRLASETCKWSGKRVDIFPQV